MYEGNEKYLTPTESMYGTGLNYLNHLPPSPPWERNCHAKPRRDQSSVSPPRLHHATVVSQLCFAGRGDERRETKLPPPRAAKSKPLEEELAGIQ
nr:hypothetical protein Itr_chr14CG16690 [Ipomoea trifida]